jgi:hypothetical protein
MALDSKKTGTIHGKSGGDKSKLQAKFDSGALAHSADYPDDFEQFAALLYAAQNLSEDVDSLRTYTGTELKGLIDTNTAKTGISTEQASLISGLQKGIINSTGHAIKFTLAENGALVIAVNRSTYTIAADR